MDQSIHMPVISRDFEIYYFVGNQNQPESYDWLKKHNESAGDFLQFEPLFRLHSHDVIEILVFLGGSCEFFCEGKTYSLKKGDVVIVPPYAVHKADVENLDNYERIILNISSRLLDDYMSSSPSMKEHSVYQKTQGSYVLHLHSKNFQDIISLLNDITKRIKRGEEDHSFTLQYLLFQALKIIFHPESSRPNLDNKDKPDQRLASILGALDKSISKKISDNWDPSQFCNIWRLFKERHTK